MGVMVLGAVLDSAALRHTITSLQYPQVSYILFFFSLTFLLTTPSTSQGRSYNTHIMPIYLPLCCIDELGIHPNQVTQQLGSDIIIEHCVYC